MKSRKALPDGEGPLDQAALSRALLRPAGPTRGTGLWREITVVGRTGSTNADLLARARSGEVPGLVLVAEEQTAGRGRMGRNWVSTPGASLTFSALLPAGPVPPGWLGWVPLLSGVAVVSALRETAGVDARLKWPNDVLADGAKLAGILAESWLDAIVVGIGINVSQRDDELPGASVTPDQAPPSTSHALPPTSLRLAAGEHALPSRANVLIAVLIELEHYYLAWLDQDRPGDPDGCGLRQEYLRRCATVGQEVRVLLPGGRSVTGTATGVDGAGRLEVSTGPGLVQVSAGDVVHLR